MKLDEVKSLEPTFIFTPITLVFTIVAFFFLVLIARDIFKNGIFESPFPIMALLTLMWFTAMTISVGYYHKVEMWEDNYLTPHIQSLPTHKKNFLRDVIVEDDDEKRLLITHDEKTYFLPLENVDVITDLKVGERPFIEYKYLEDDVSDYEKGVIDVKLYTNKKFVLDK